MTPSAAAREPELSFILMRWLAGLRWAVFALLAAMLPFGDRVFGFHVRWAVALPILALVVAGGLFVGRALRRGVAFSTRALALGAALDIAAIGGLLAASGGAANPMSALFFVHVALAASRFPARTTFSLAALAACVFASLFALPSGACCPNHPGHGAFSTHLIGMWVAFVLAAGLVAYFLTRVRLALDAREREITLLRRRADEDARFVALGTLAAGTAHELGTPLGTIAVLAGEIADQGSAEARAHAEVISAEIARCRGILTKMSAGARRVESGSSSLVRAAEHAITAWRRAHPGAEVTLDEAIGAAEASVPLPFEDVEASVLTLLDNALHAMRAAGSADPIRVTIARDGEGRIALGVEDAGTGVAPALEGRLGEPFLTTKEPGEGMGLGLYLVRAMLGQAGGRLAIEPRSPRGTRVVLSFEQAS